MCIKRRLLHLFLCVVLCSVGVTLANAAEDTFTVVLNCSTDDYHVDSWLGWPCTNETIEIPKGRPIYALLVSGFDQNSRLDTVHWYDFVRCLLEKGAYVHHARWNNLLHPYMKAPLHSVNSVPSHGSWNWGAGYPHHDMYPRDWPYSLFGPSVPLGLTDYRTSGKVGIYWKTPNKAIPAEDYQFQKDAEMLLHRIRQENPDAMIILVGHSMGGDAVIRLADEMPATIDVELLAPIDPVGNRTCVKTHCGGLDLFTRYYTVREDTGINDAAPKRVLGKNIKYLYHRWQNEATPPWDYYKNYGLETEAATPGAEATISDQSSIPMNPNSGLEVPGNNLGGWFDGHGEIVGFRGSMFNPFGFETNSEPLALKFQGNWPRGEGCDDTQSDADCRVYHLKKWEDDPNYLFKRGFEPWNPGLCRVSRDLCNILDSIVPDAGPDDLVARAKSGKVSLSWTPLQDATGYNVYRSETSGGPYDLIAADHVTSYATYLDATVANGTAYYYVVTVLGASQESSPSNEAAATPTSRLRR